MGSPHYDPAVVAELAATEETRAITLVASDSCAELGLADEDVWEVLLDLNASHCRFYKSMPSNQRPDEMLDVYDVWVRDIPIYLKFKITTSRDRSQRVVVVLSFKRNEHFV
jgi:hypothetical protein